MKYLAQIKIFHDNELKTEYSYFPDIFHFNDVFTLLSNPANFIIFDAKN